MAFDPGKVMKLAEGKIIPGTFFASGGGNTYSDDGKGLIQHDQTGIVIKKIDYSSGVVDDANPVDVVDSALAVISSR